MADDRPIDLSADSLPDIHSMHQPCRSIMVCVKRAKSVAFSTSIGVRAELLFVTGHPAGPRMIERGAFADTASPRTAMLIECGQHWEKSAADVAITTGLRFVLVAGAVEETCARPRLRLKPPPLQRFTRIPQDDCPPVRC